MAYIGPLPAETFTSFATQEFSTSATTSYTLDHAVTNENEIALFINNVRQQPGSGKAYTAAGTALTLSANTASTDTMYCVFLGRALQTVNPATNSITTAMISDDAVTAAKIADAVSFGKIGQVVSTTLSTVTSTTSDSFSDISGLAVSITPSATSSKVLVFVNLSLGSQAAYSAQLRLMRDSTAICIGTDSGIGGSQVQATFHQKGWSDTAIVNQGMNFLDSPSSTSSISYNVEWRETENTTLYLNRMYTTSNNVSYPWVASTITAMEVLT